MYVYVCNLDTHRLQYCCTGQRKSIWSGDLRTGKGEVVISDGGGSARGMNFDLRTGYLFVACSSAGDIRSRRKSYCTHGTAHALNHLPL